MSDEIPDPTKVEAVYIVTFHIVKTVTGTFSVTAYDLLGEELAKAPLVPDAENWGEALLRFWASVYATVSLIQNRDLN